MHRATDPPPTLRNTQRVALGLGTVFAGAALSPKWLGGNRAVFTLLAFLAFCLVVASEITERYRARFDASCLTTRTGGVLLKLEYDPKRVPADARIKCYVSNIRRNWWSEVDPRAAAEAQMYFRLGEQIHVFPEEFVSSSGRPPRDVYRAEWKLEYFDRQGAFVQRTVAKAEFRYGGRGTRRFWRRKCSRDGG